MRFLSYCIPYLPFSNSHGATTLINSRSYRILRLLGEGGFSYVYLVADAETGQEFALKKIRCTNDPESLTRALKEVQANRLFQHPYIIKIHDYAVVQELDGSKTIYVLLPYYGNGNLQDLINSSVVVGTEIPDALILSFARDVCTALTQLHEYHVPFGDESNEDDIDDDSHKPLMGTREIMDTAQRPGERLAYAHFDLKPGNVMVSGTNGIVLMDFGSCGPARKCVTSRAVALRIQDEAAVNSTMPYRAPELFDCKTNSIIDEKVDIWSLGCLIYALKYGHSPFETIRTESGSISLAILNCQYSMRPETSPEALKIQSLIRQCLELAPALRPSAKDLVCQIDIQQHD